MLVLLYFENFNFYRSNFKMCLLKGQFLICCALQQIICLTVGVHKDLNDGFVLFPAVAKNRTFSLSFKIHLLS